MFARSWPGQAAAAQGAHTYRVLMGPERFRQAGSRSSGDLPARSALGSDYVGPVPLLGYTKIYIIG